MRALPQIDENLLGLGIPDGTALALGPQGQLEMWGEGAGDRGRQRRRCGVLIRYPDQQSPTRS